MKKGTATFTLPGDEPLLDEYKNDKSITITDRTIMQCPKEGIIIYMIEYEKEVDD